MGSHFRFCVKEFGPKFPFVRIPICSRKSCNVFELVTTSQFRKVSVLVLKTVSLNNIFAKIFPFCVLLKNYWANLPICSRKSCKAFSANLPICSRAYCIGATNQNKPPLQLVLNDSRSNTLPHRDTPGRKSARNLSRYGAAGGAPETINTATATDLLSLYYNVM